MKSKIFIFIFTLLILALWNEAFARDCVHGPWHCVYTSSGQLPVWGWRNDGDKVYYAVNSSTRSRVVPYTETVAPTAYSDWEWNTTYSCPYWRTDIYTSVPNWWWWYTNQLTWCTRTTNITQYYTEHLYCPTGKEFVLNDKNQNAWLAVNVWNRSGMLTCFVKDNTPPPIEVISSQDFSCTDTVTAWKLETLCVHAWTNKDVSIDVTNISDVWLWLKKKRFKINAWVETPLVAGSFPITFTEEWTYVVTIWAEDISSAAWDTWGSSWWVWNITEVTHVVNIDKHGPVLSAPPTTNTGWVDVKPTITFKILDNYKWDVTQIKKFDCVPKPNNSTWTWSTNSEWKVVWTCIPSAGNNYCTNDSYFTPNMSACDWDCNIWYTEYNGQCYANEETLTCNSNLLPLKSYKYAVNNTVELESNDNQSYWIAPTNIDVDGNFTTYFSVVNGQYSPTLWNCTFDCKNGYHIENGKCVNDVKIRCCNTPYLSTSTAGARVDCSLAENALNVQCQNSVICWQDKEVLWEWNRPSTRWDYSTTNDGTKAWEAWFGLHCWFAIFTNSDWDTCNPWYFLEYYTNGNPEKCSAVPVWEWSWQENQKHACTNKPNYAYYTSNGTNNDCQWECIWNYTKNWNSCAAATRNQNCTAKPANSVWNNVSSITQTWNGSDWAPSVTSTFNVNGSNSQCRFECANSWQWYGYHWNGSACEENVKNSSCDNASLPANASWNNAWAIAQYWNGSDWTPSNQGTYDPQPSNSECRFECNPWYVWDWNSCNETRSVNCTNIPNNSQYNNAWNINQVKDDFWVWQPSNVSTYNTNSSWTQCRFKCNNWKNWNGSSCN